MGYQYTSNLDRRSRFCNEVLNNAKQINEEERTAHMLVAYLRLDIDAGMIPVSPFPWMSLFMEARRNMCFIGESGREIGRERDERTVLKLGHHYCIKYYSASYLFSNHFRLLKYKDHFPDQPTYLRL